MDEPTIKALMVLDTTVVEGQKVIQIPYEDLLRGKISIRINQPQGQPVTLRTVEPPVTSIKVVPHDKTEAVISIPTEIQKLYPLPMKGKMAQDVADYLGEIARCWEFKNLGFQPSLLKKAAKSKPALNRVIFQAYGKEGDSYLTALVKENMEFIHQYWKDHAFDNAVK